ncbi:MAG: four helix bundle protein [Bacteroidota bacterium]
MEEFLLDIVEIEESKLQESAAPYDSSRDFVTLEAWKRCREVRLFIYQQILKRLPPEEKYDLGSQMRRAAISIILNIAEGHGRYHFKEGIQYYRISRGSLYELKDGLIICLDNEYIDRQLFDQGISLIEMAKSTLNGYIKFVQKQRANTSKSKT